MAEDDDDEEEEDGATDSGPVAKATPVAQTTPAKSAASRYVVLCASLPSKTCK